MLFFVLFFCGMICAFFCAFFCDMICAFFGAFFCGMICAFFCGMICGFFGAFFCGMNCGPGRKKAQKTTGIWTIFLKIWGGEPGATRWGAGSDKVRSRERWVGSRKPGWSREPEPIWTWLSSCNQCNHNLPSFLSFLFPLAVRARNPGHLLPFQS